jgi:nitroimidazol reductase NimA-like FMN-containing flavoprotein (pyridoxamine 5'-phosphate oxidase superfamily)
MPCSYKLVKKKIMSDYKKTSLNKVVRGSIRASYDVNAINKILDAGFLGQVSYIYEGNAISLPMSYGHIDNEIYLHGSLKNRMMNALLEAKKASMTVMHLDGLVLARSHSTIRQTIVLQ